MSPVLLFLERLLTSSYLKMINWKKWYFPSKYTLLLTLALRIGTGQILGFAVI